MRDQRVLAVLLDELEWKRIVPDGHGRELFIAACENQGWSRSPWTKKARIS